MKNIFKISTLPVMVLSLLCITPSSSEDLKNKLKSEKDRMIHDVTHKFNSNLESFLSKNFETSEVSLSSGTTNEVVGNILVVKPLSDVNNKNTTTFAQGSIFLSDDSRETINLGIGTRKLTNDDTLMLGANLFYDYEFEYDHQRASLGLEAKTSVGEITFNEYLGFSGWKTGFQDQSEKALNGSDLEFGAPLPYLPWTNFYYRSFKWEGASGNADQKGDDISLEAKMPSGLNLEIGKRSFDDTTEDEEFVRVTWTCCNNDDDETFGVSDTAYNLTSVENKRFAKVRRENLIVKQKGMNLSVIGF